MSLLPHDNLDAFRRDGHALIDWIADYWTKLQQYPEQFPVMSAAKPGDVAAALPRNIPQAGRAFAEIFAETQQAIMPGITHWQSPSFFAFFPANTSPPAVLGELFSAGLGVNGMLWATSPACTELEQHVLDQLAGLCGLPKKFLFSSGTGGGVIQGTASEAAVVAMVAARKRLADRGIAGQPVVYCSTQAHSSIVKAAMITGIASGPGDAASVRQIPVDSARAMYPARLKEAIEQDLAAGRAPCMVTATLGTTSSLAFDDVLAIAAICRKHNVWLHVDSAMAGAAAVCPEFRWMLAGLEQVDSYCFNPHKWLLVNFDCDCLYVSDKAALTSAMSITPEYLKNAASTAGAVVDYRDWQIPLGRRFRALKLHFVLQSYGVDGLQKYIREHIRLGTVFAELVKADARFELVDHSRGMNLICFRPRPKPGEAPHDTDVRAKALLDAVNAGGKVYLTHTVIPYVVPTDSAVRTVLRMSIGSTFTQESHVRAAWEMIQAAL
jgi:aromatic-L-amino-acid decarboxylase